MSDRSAKIEAFLAAAGWSPAARTPIAGDSSGRRYDRLFLRDRTAILMDAEASAPTDETARFVLVGRWLRSHGYSAPEVLADDTDAGLLLLEDLGDDLFARVLAADAMSENRLYSCTTDFLLDLHRHVAPDFATRHDGARLAALTDLAEAWFLPSIGCDQPDGLAEVKAIFIAAYGQLDTLPSVLSLRDFHAENLLWLPHRHGIARCGLLDFQDAIATHPAYDLVSLLQDARRDVSTETEVAMVARYLQRRAVDPDQFRAMYALIGVQRALRILGIFARLAHSLGKPQYLDFVPRVWSNLQRNLRHPALAALGAALGTVVPHLGDEELARMRSAWHIPDR